MHSVVPKHIGRFRGVLLGIAAVATVLLTLSSGTAVFATPPPPPQNYVIIAGEFVGVSMEYELVPGQGLLELTVPMEQNVELQIEGIITRQPGDAQSAFFSGAIGKVQLTRAPVLDLYDQEVISRYSSRSVEQLLLAEEAPLRKIGALLKNPLQNLQWAEDSALRDSKDINEELLAAIYEAQVRIYEARDFSSQMKVHPKRRTRAKLRSMVESARRATQGVFTASAEQGLDLGYDVVLLDDKSYPSLAWNTETGRFGGYCPNPNPVYGIGTVEATTHGYRLSAQTMHLRIEASVDTLSHSGTATIRTVAGDTVCTIIDADYTRS